MIRLVMHLHLLIWMGKVGGVPVRVGGMAKGSGMINPNMATMLGVCKISLLVYM